VLIALEGPDGDALRPLLGPAASEAELAHALAVVRASTGVGAALDRARAFNDEAAAALDRLPSSAARDGLASLPGAYLERTLEEKAPDLVLTRG
jgi:hypothetical protein